MGFGPGQGGHRPHDESRALLNEAGGREGLLRFTNEFYRLCFADPHLDKFIRAHDDPHGERFASWVTEKFGAARRGPTNAATAKSARSKVMATHCRRRTTALLHTLQHGTPRSESLQNSAGISNSTTPAFGCDYTFWPCAQLGCIRSARHSVRIMRSSSVTSAPCTSGRRFNSLESPPVGPKTRPRLGGILRMAG